MYLIMRLILNIDGNEIVRFADSIIDDIYDKFKVKLEIEPTLI